MTGQYSYTPALVSHGANVSVTIPAADTLTLNTTDVELVPAPGVGRIIVVRHVVAYKAAGVAGTGGGDLRIGYDGGATVIDITRGSAFPAGRMIRSALADVPGNGVVASLNTAIVLSMATGDMAANDQDLTLHIVYDVFEVE